MCLLLLTYEPPDLEEKEETKEDVEDNPATKDLNALRLALSCWHPFDMFVLLHTEREGLERMKKSFFSRVKNICVCFFCILFRVYNPNFKNCFSLRVEKKNKTLTRVLIKGGASLSLLFSSLITSLTHSLREEHERRLSSHNEQQRKEREREKKRLLYSFVRFFPFT